MNNNKEHYFYLSSIDSQDIHPSNKPTNFIVDLGKTYQFPGEWIIEVVEVKFSIRTTKNRNLYILCDLAEPTYGCDVEAPILRRIPSFTSGKSRKISEAFINCYPMKLTQQSISQIYIYIRGDHLNPISFISSHVDVTLRFRKNE